MNSCIRLINNTYKDLYDIDAKFIDMGATKVSSVFTNSDNISGSEFKENTYIFDLSDNSKLEFTDKFTVSFWAKFTEKAITDDVYGNKIVIAFDDNTSIVADIPTTVGVKNNFWVKIDRDSNGLVNIYIDNVSIKSDTNTATFNLSNNSFIFIGNSNRYATGYDVVIDDLFVLDSDGLNAIPTDYINTSKYTRMLYIDVATGAVYGYKEVI